MSFLFKSDTKSTPVQTTTSNTIPQWVSQGGKDIFEASKPIVQREYPSYPVADRVAPFNQDTAQSFGKTRQNMGSWEQAFKSAYGGFGAAANPVGPADIQKYMNPFTEQVINAQTNHLNRQHERNTNQRHAQMAQRGSYLNEGRRAIIDNLANEGHARVLAEMGAAQRSQAFNNALGQANTERQRMIQAAQGFATLAPVRQQLGANDASQLRNIGYTQEARDQQMRDLRYNQFREQFYYPQEQANWIMSLLQGTPYNTQSIQSGQHISQSQSPLTQAAGAAAGIAGLGNIFDWW